MQVMVLRRRNTQQLAPICQDGRFRTSPLDGGMDQYPSYNLSDTDLWSSSGNHRQQGKEETVPCFRGFPAMDLREKHIC